MNAPPRLPSPETRRARGPAPERSLATWLAVGGILLTVLVVCGLTALLVPQVMIALWLGAPSAVGLLMLAHYLLWGRLLEQWSREKSGANGPEKFWLRTPPPAPPRDDDER